MLDLRSQTAREAYEGIRVLFLGACTVLFYEVFRAADAPWAILAGNLALGAVFWTVLLVVHELGHAAVGALTGTVLRFDVGNGRALVDTTIRGVRVVIRPFPLEGRVHAIVRGRRLWRARRAAVYVAGVTVEWLVVGVALLLLSDEMLTRPSSSELAPFTMLLFTTIVGTGFNLLPGIVDRDGLEMITDGLGVLEALTMSAEEAESLRRMAEPGEFVGALLAGDAEEAARMLDLAAVSDPELIDALRDLLPLARRERPPQVDRVFRDDANRELFEGLRGGLAAALALETQRAGGPLDELLEWWQGFAPDEPLLILLRARQSARRGEAGAGVEALTALLASPDLPRDFAPLVSIEYWIRHRYQPSEGWMTWTLDYRKHSDFDDSVGFWRVEPHPDKDGWSRVFYSADVRASGWVPAPIENAFATVGLKRATAWVKRESEKAAGTGG